MTKPDTELAEHLVEKAWSAMPPDLQGVDKVAWFAGIALAKAGADLQTACTAFASLTAKQAERPIWVTMETRQTARARQWGTLAFTDPLSKLREPKLPRPARRALMATGGTSGGKKFKREMREMRTRDAALADTVAEVGFFSPHVAAIARLHEYGSKARDGTKLPERPAFRGAMSDMGEAMTSAIKSEAGTGRGVPSRTPSLPALEGRRKRLSPATATPLARQSPRAKRPGRPERSGRASC